MKGTGGREGKLTGVVEQAVVLEQNHLAVQVDDLLPHPHQLLRRPRLRRAHHPVLQLLRSPKRNADKIRRIREKRKKDPINRSVRRTSRYLLPDDVVLLLPEEEPVELVELGLEEGDERGFLRRHRRRRGSVPDARALAPPLAAGAEELEPLLEVLVGQELVPPLGQRLHDLVVQALAELHHGPEAEELGAGIQAKSVELLGDCWWNGRGAR
jgi:hypothetical protein